MSDAPSDRTKKATKSRFLRRSLSSREVARIVPPASRVPKECEPASSERLTLRCTGPDGVIRRRRQFDAPARYIRCCIPCMAAAPARKSEDVVRSMPRNCPQPGRAAAAMIRSSRVMLASTSASRERSAVQWLTRLSRAEATARRERSAKSASNQCRVVRLSAQLATNVRRPSPANNRARKRIRSTHQANLARDVARASREIVAALFATMYKECTGVDFRPPPLRRAEVDGSRSLFGGWLASLIGRRRDARRNRVDLRVWSRPPESASRLADHLRLGVARIWRRGIALRGQRTESHSDSWQMVPGSQARRASTPNNHE